MKTSDSPCPFTGIVCEGSRVAGTPQDSVANAARPVQPQGAQAYLVAYLFWLGIA